MKATAAKTTSRRPAAGHTNGSSKTSAARKSTERKSSTEDTQDNHSKLHDLFVEELKDIYWAEKALTKAIPKMIKKATSEDLVDALEAHLEETEGHVERCESVFELLGKTAQAKKCEAMAGLIKEAEEIMEESEDGVMRDAGIISAAQKVEHYEIATYGTLCQFAKTLGLDEVKNILGKTLQEEKNADDKLTTVAESAINVEAAQEEVEG